MKAIRAVMRDPPKRRMMFFQARETLLVLLPKGGGTKRREGALRAVLAPSRTRAPSGKKLRRMVLGHDVVGSSAKAASTVMTKAWYRSSRRTRCRPRAPAELHVIEGQICTGAGGHARRQLTALAPIVAAVALERVARRLVVAGRTVGAGRDAGLAADAHGVILNHRTVFQLV